MKTQVQWENNIKRTKRIAFTKKSLLETKQCMEKAYSGLDNAQEQEVIDMYIYEINACYLRYQLLLQDMRMLTSDEDYQKLQISSKVRHPIKDLVSQSLVDLPLVSDILQQ